MIRIIERNGIKYKLRSLSFYEQIIIAEHALKYALVTSEPKIDVRELDVKELFSLWFEVVDLTNQQMRKEYEMLTRGVKR